MQCATPVRRGKAMIRILLVGISVLLLSTGAASAEWTKIGAASKAADAFTLYVDLATIQRNGKLVRMWDLQDFKQPQTLGEQKYLSEKTHLEFDCEAKKARILAIVDFSGQMAAGEIIYSDGDASDWTVVVAKTTGEMEWNAACGKK